MQQRHTDELQLARASSEAMQRCTTCKALRRMIKRADAAAGASVMGATPYAAGGLIPLMYEELRGVLVTELKNLTSALAPAYWQCPRGANAMMQGPLESRVLVPGRNALVPGHVISSTGVMAAALDGPRCIRTQAALARSGAQVTALQQCDSLTQLVRGVLGQPSGVVAQLGRGIAVEQLAAPPADVLELSRAFERVPELVRLLPRRAQSAVGRLLMAQQRLLLAHFCDQKFAPDHLDCLGYDTVLQTLKCFQNQDNLPCNWLQCWRPTSPSPPAMEPEGAEGEGVSPKPEAVSRAALKFSGGTTCAATTAPEEPALLKAIKTNPQYVPASKQESTSEPEPELEHESLKPDLVTEADQIRKVLAQVHPDMKITSAAIAVLNDILFRHCEPLLIASAWQRVRERLVEDRLAQEAALAQEACASSPRPLSIDEMEVRGKSSIVLVDYSPA